MKVYDRKFDNYVNSRNHSLKKVKTKRALVLDADELITIAGFTKIGEHLDNPPNAYNGGFNFTFKGVYVKQIKIEDNVHNPRLFEISKNLKYISDYNDGSFETLRCLINFYHPELRCSWGYAEDRPGFISLPKSVPIFHFHSPNSQETDLKKERWYNHPEIWKKGPSKVIGFKEWKAFNPKRDEYR
jgi:hypothetical protein